MLRMFGVFQSKTLQAALLVVCLGYVVRVLIKGYGIRRRRRQNPGPPAHSWLFGDLIEIGKIAASLPSRVHPHVYPHFLRKKFNLGSVFYLDFWPVAYPTLVVMDPAMCQQVSTEYNAMKHEYLPKFLTALVGADDMVSANGPVWKKWRSIFNPGFSTQHLMTLVPGIVDDAIVYLEKLNEHAEKNEIFRLEEDTTRLTIDVIGKVTLDMEFNMQRGDNECIDALREQVHYLANETMNPFTMWHPYGIYRRWRNDRIMKRYIGKVLDERFASKASVANQKDRKRTIIDLALDSYLTSSDHDPTSEKITEPTTANPVMDAAFREMAITQIRLFLFAGHDTTSSTICYIFYLLRRHPSVLARIRHEHETILGPLPTTAARIRADPTLLHQLEYTLCVLKETLRLFPVASAPKQGEPGLFLTDPQTGAKFPTDKRMVWLVHHGLGHNPDVWGPDVEAFRPERFLPRNAHLIPDGAFRAFEHGYRNCLGQNLAIVESKIILALTCRAYEFDVCLDAAALREVGRDGSFYARDASFRGARQDVGGEECYQVLIGAAKPREGMPVRVRRVEWEA